jgi:adenylate kinase family enzyme
MKTKFIGVYGETCAGKSTVGEYLSSAMNCRYISFGDLKRDEIANSTEIGVLIEDLLRSGSRIHADLGGSVKL